MSFVSVIMSTYNRQNLIKEAVESVLNQSFSDFEFLIIDDNSDDETFEILKTYKDSRIRLFRNDNNCGCTFNYHNAQNLSEGEIIAHIDDDDIWKREKLEKQINFLKEHPDYTLIGSFIETFGENSRPSWVFDTNPDKIAFLMNFYNPLCHSSIVYRKSFMLEHGINYDINKKCSQDYDLYKQVIFAGGKLSNLPEILIEYRMHKKRLTDIKVTQDIQIYNAEKVKYELLSRFLNEEEINHLKEMLYGFPFNEYNCGNVVTAIENAGNKYCQKFGIKPDIIYEFLNDIKNGVYTF